MEIKESFFEQLFSDIIVREIEHGQLQKFLTANAFITAKVASLGSLSHNRLKGINKFRYQTLIYQECFKLRRDTLPNYALLVIAV